MLAVRQMLTTTNWEVRSLAQDLGNTPTAAAADLLHKCQTGPVPLLVLPLVYSTSPPAGSDNWSCAARPLHLLLLLLQCHRHHHRIQCKAFFGWDSLYCATLRAQLNHILAQGKGAQQWGLVPRTTPQHRGLN
ncbi:hypothetical protein Pmani_023777 [Petrolisthes manimaculis]|uniref:Uncharacterized protein n=1 Tax=Petrolisthes manimaculis TaxID=1843537 RepID=A0AAE1PB30_9EUCA|nr:hypothetical protein Pmani_023777 [Petrolisthes manimaculis]